MDNFIYLLLLSELCNLNELCVFYKWQFDISVIQFTRQNKVFIFSGESYGADVFLNLIYARCVILIVNF